MYLPRLRSVLVILAIAVVLSGLLGSAGAAAAAGGSAPATESLAGMTWVLQQYAVQRAAFAPAVGQPKPTILFGTDGRVNGNAGCNSYSGGYSQSAGELSFDSLLTTLKACDDAEVTAQEQLLLRVLSGKTVYTIESNRLSISGPAGALIFGALNDTPGMPKTGHGMETGWLVLLGTIFLSLGLVVRRRVVNTH